MPLFAALFSSIAGGFATLLAAIVSRDLAMKGAAYSAYIAITATFLAATFVCISSLWNMAASFASDSGGIDTIGGAIAIGIGVLVPSNAATVLSCCAAVWSASQVYKIQKTGVIAFGS